VDVERASGAAAAALAPTLRANPYPEVTDPFCRLPLPTLTYGLEAAHLGDLMRLSVRPGVRAFQEAEAQIFKGRRGRTGQLAGEPAAVPGCPPDLRVMRFRGGQAGTSTLTLSSRKENSPRGPRRRLRARPRYRLLTARPGNERPVPFR